MKAILTLLILFCRSW